jgi:predicted outer membrane protein
MKTGSTILPAITVSILLLVLSGAVIAQDTSTVSSPFLRRMQSTPAAPAKKMSDKDVQFISRVAGHNEAEIAYGKMAESKAQSAAVKKIAAQLVNDHARMNKDLVALGEKKGLKLNPGAICKWSRKSTKTVSPISKKQPRAQTTTTCGPGPPEIYRCLKRISRWCATRRKA